MLKDSVERYLTDYAGNQPDIKMKPAKTSTGIYKNGLLLMRIYYRLDAIRINIKPGTWQHGEYELLLREGLVYQKSSANPYGDDGTFSFFVDEKDIPLVLKRLIESKTPPTQELLTDYTLHRQQQEVDKETRDLKVEEFTTPQSSKQPDGQDNVVAQASKGQYRIEKKLDSLIGAITAMRKESVIPVKTEPPKEEKTDNRYRIEITQGNTPFLFLKKKTTITGLILSIKLYAAGPDTNTEPYLAYFINTKGEQISNSQSFMPVANEEYNCRFELDSSASEEKQIYLVIKGENTAADEARQLIECPVSIAFSADFGI